MDIKLSKNLIIEQCGTVSYKSGKTFYRSNKIMLLRHNNYFCKAAVEGKERFYVTVRKKDDGTFNTECTCPKLASVKTDCQHIAAVLLLLYNLQQQESGAPSLTDDVMSLFQNEPRRPMGEQLHFEERKVLDPAFTCRPVTTSRGNYLLGIELNFGPIKVREIQEFLEHVNKGDTYRLSASFNYDPQLHCFSRDTNEVIKQLMQIASDEKSYFSREIENRQLLLIPPSSWEKLQSLLTAAPLVKLEFGDHTYDGLNLSEQRLPLQFYFLKNNGAGYQLKIKGLHQIIVLETYSLVLADGKFHQLAFEDCKRLSELKDRLRETKENQVPIPAGQLDPFLKNTAASLKRLGKVSMADEVTDQFSKPMLVAKLYLDRLKNRLLASLEFCYENIRINPLDGREIQSAELLIRDMTKEITILDLMEAGAFTKTEESYFLHHEELEYEFLYHILPKLQQHVQVYATTAVRARIVRKNRPPRINVKIKKERTNWLEFKFSMDGIPEKDIRGVLEALEEKRKYYRLRDGALLSLETHEYKEIQRFLNAVPAQDKDWEHGLNVPFLKGMQLMDAIDSDEVFSVEQSFRDFLDDIKNPDPDKFEVPENLKDILRNYQKHGYRWMKTLAQYGFGGVLADDMGLGKTIQSIAYIQSELENIRREKRPVLIVCPSSLTYNWLEELKKFAPDIRTVIADGTREKRKQKLEPFMEMDIIITSYPLLRQDSKIYKKMHFHTVFFDEAQAFKNPITQTARTVVKIEAEHRFALTGTPMENSLEELWSIFHVVLPELFQGMKEYGNLTRKQITRRVSPFMLRRMKKNVLEELPGKTEWTDTVQLLPEQKGLYAAYLAKLKHDTFKHLDKETIRKNRIKILAGITRLRQICCHPALFVDGFEGSSAKFDRLMRIIEEAGRTGRRVLIFSQFTGMLEIIGRKLAISDLPYFYLDGKTPSEERLGLCRRFNEGERDLFLISLKAGGTGLNLTGADTVILYDLWWNPAVEEQAADRAHRIGQSNEVEVIKLITSGTIEEKINELQTKKRELIGEVIESNEETLAGLTDEDIREILMPGN